MRFRLADGSVWGRYVFLTLFFVVLFCGFSSAAMPIGSKVGEVLSTDIIATIDGQPIPSMNINGYTAVVVEDLRHYGFTVHWNEQERTLKATRNPSLEIRPIMFTAKQTEPGKVLNPVLYTDIKTFLDGREIVSFNIDGRTAMYFNQLRSHGELVWNEVTRTAAFTFPDPVLEETGSPGPEESAVTRRSTQLNPEESYLHNQPLDRSDMPETIKVGLFYGDTAVTSLQLGSGNGFLLGEFDNDQFTPLVRLPSVYQLQLSIEDSVYFGLKSPFDNAASAQQVVDSLQGKGFQAVLAREPMGWNVYAGNAASMRESEAITAFLDSRQEDWKLIANQNDHIRVQDNSGKSLLVFHSRSPLYLTAFTEDLNQSILQVGNAKYRGAVTATRKNSPWLTVINRLHIEQYLYGVVPREMPHAWHLEALKAQAVAARGFAMANIGKYEQDGFDLCNTVNTQVYGGYSSEQQRTNQAVDLTSGKVMTYNGKLAIPYYHANSGGRTESSEYVWNEVVPYVRGIDDPYSLDAPHAEWETTLSLQEIELMLLQRQIDVGRVTDLMITDISPNGRVQEVLITGSQGIHRLHKQQTRWVFDLRSNYYVISQQDSNFVFHGRGYGHGIGMSQHGARAMAEAGYSWQQILAHYYSGIRIE